MAAEGAAPMMVLAVDIVGNRAAQRHELRAWDHSWEEAIGRGVRDDVAKQRAGIGFQHAGLGVEGADAVKRPHVDHHAGIVLATVAVGAAIAVAEQ